MISCCEAAKQMAKIEEIVSGYKKVAEVFADRPYEDYLTATNEVRRALIKNVCKSVMDDEIDTEVLLCFAGKLMDATEEVYQGSDDESDLSKIAPELDSVFLDMEDEFAQFSEDFDRHVKAVFQAYTLYRDGRLKKETADQVSRRAHNFIMEAYSAGLIGTEERSEYYTDLINAREGRV